MLYFFCYLVALIVFAAIDITWLKTMGGEFYVKTLGDILAPEVRTGPAAAFYLLYPIGLVYFAVLPALKSGMVSTALMNGALFGLFTYGTYELTNYATLKNWTFNIAVIDCLYGAMLGLVVSGLTYVAGPALARLFSGAA